MTKTRLAWAMGALLVTGVLNAQQPAATPTQSKYDPHALFSPLFYTQSGNEYRAATGEPGPAYWQNKVDYQINAKLDDTKNEVSGTVTISYKNKITGVLKFRGFYFGIFSPSLTAKNSLSFLKPYLIFRNIFAAIVMHVFIK